jgi:transcriptional regulator of arginine metabolism
MKDLRHNAIRDLLSRSEVASQDQLRRKLRRLGYAVTQATLSRDIHELHLFKGPRGYSLPNGNGTPAGPAIEIEQPTLDEMLENFVLSARQAMNQVVVRTMMGGAQPVAAALDRANWPEVAGTVAGDDTVLIVCPDLKRAADVESRLRKMLES